MASSLSIDVFNSGYKPIPGGPGWDDSTPATWPASTSTLISGDRDAVLVDALLTTSEGERLAAWVQNTGKRPRAIFVTHGHGDHFFGAGPVLDAFPDAQLMACDQQVVDEARGQTSPEVMAIWNSWFAGQFSQSPAVPVLTSSQDFGLEGHPLLFRTIGAADGAWIAPPEQWIEEAESRLAAGKLAALLHASLDDLPDRQREVVTLRDVEGMSTEETAQHLAIRPETVKTRLHRDRRLMRAAIEEQLTGAFAALFPFDGERCVHMADRVLGDLRSLGRLGA